MMKEDPYLSTFSRPDADHLNPANFNVTSRGNDYPYDEPLGLGQPNLSTNRANGMHAQGHSAVIVPHDTDHTVYQDTDGLGNPELEAAGTPISFSQSDRGSEIGPPIPGMGGSWASNPPKPWDDNDDQEQAEGERAFVLAFQDMHDDDLDGLVAAKQQTDLLQQKSVWKDLVAQVLAQELFPEEKEMKLSVEELRHMVNSVLLEAKSKKKDKKEKEDKVPGYQTAEALDFSKPLGNFNPLKVGGQANWGPQTSGDMAAYEPLNPIPVKVPLGEKFLPADSAWQALCEEINPDNIWENIKFEYDLSEKKAKLGSGARFKAVAKQAAKSGAKNPAAVAAAAGMKKFGKKRMEKLAQKGKK